MSDFKTNLRRLARQRGITIAHLGRETNIAPQTLNNWLAGQEPRSLEKIKRVANYFGTTIDDLCFRNNTAESSSKKIEFSGYYEVILKKMI